MNGTNRRKNGPLLSDAAFEALAQRTANIVLAKLEEAMPQIEERISKAVRESLYEEWAEQFGRTAAKRLLQLVWALAVAGLLWLLHKAGITLPPGFGKD